MAKQIEAPQSGGGAAMSTATRWLLGLLAAVLLAAAIGLWARHGSAVFFDLIASGIAYCF